MRCLAVKDGWQKTNATVASFLRYQTKIGPMYEVVFTYKVDGSWLGGTFTTMHPYREGDTLPLFYDPKNPERNNLARREGILRWVYIAFFVLMGALAVYLFYSPK
jgi:hypothetical protein